SWCQDVVIYDEEPGTTVDGDCRLAFGYYPNGMTSTGEMNYKFDAWTLDGRSEAYIYQWSFGDGSEDEGQSVDHGYAAGDVYYVCVEAWEGDKFICSWCDEVRIGDEQDNECQLGFEIYRDDSDAQDAFEWYKFEAYLPGSVGADQYEFKWTLGDGRFAYGPAIRHNFTDGGVYEVCLEAYRNDELVCTWCDKVLIDDTPDQGCQLAFDYEPNGERNAADVPVMDFKAWTLDGYDADYDYRWEFGDGRGAAGQRVTHDFKEPGVYKVCVGAFTGEYYVCHWCTEVEVEAVPNEGCQLAFSYAPDYSTTDDLNWYDFKAWTLDGNADNYTYKWDFGDDQTSAGQTARNGFTDPGAYKVCVDAYDGERFVCSWCSEVRVEEELQDEDCQIAFAYYEEEPMEGRQRFKFELESLSDNEEGYTYKWSFDNGESAEGRTATTAYTEEGIYTVCVDAYLGDEYVCGWCERIKVEEIPEWLPCDLDVAFEKDELSVWLKVREDYAKYYWDFGDGTTANERSVTHTYAEPGSYFICLEVVDRNGEHCSRCEMVTVRKEEEPYVDPCIDTDKIDYDVACTTDVKPVCGCDNVTYKNSCVAENYYGIKEWVEGPCERDEPGDELVICETDFKYSAFKVSDTRYLFEFHADETPDAIFFWDFGDGSEPSVEQSPTHYYDLPEAGDAAITACLYVIKRNEDAADDEPSYCLASYCETLAIDDARDAFIEGTITSGGEGFRRKIERRSGGGEPLADVKVLLLDVFGQVIRHDLTDDNGQYHFEELLFGDYSVKVEIDGIDHEPVPVQLDPLHQDEEDLDFEVTEEAISTGIEEQAFAKSINLFPNPTTGSIQLAFDLQEATNLQIKVTNLFGQTLQLREADFTVGAQQVELNLSEYAAGIYMITISTPTESFSRRVVRQE
ncbi:MAG: PKD domain-containing protein, partial [Bacteroidota bacterium]